MLNTHKNCTKNGTINQRKCLNENKIAEYAFLARL